MDTILEILIDEKQKGERIDKVVSRSFPELTRSRVQNLIEEKNITLNNEAPITKNYKARLGDKIKIIIKEPQEIEAEPENIPLDIVYEDDDLLVVNKPKGMVVHPAVGNYTKTLVNALLFHCQESLSGINGAKRPGIVHRIDKDTSGLLIVAKNDFSHKGLAEQIKEHSFKREYEAMVYGNLKNDKGTIDAPIGRHKLNRKKMAVRKDNSKHAITHYEVIKRYDKFTHVRLILETGRTHQIRVHMSYIGHPVAGDPFYGPKKVITELKGQCLHARTIGFVHPRTKKYMEFKSDLPEYFKEFCKKQES
ncbi:MAG: Ribosomal large subunit pseudouridine synthase D [Eubacteriales bacterium SKADARSKE-1]|nr:Ribosomal large subunit pseudouridine synthase D [Eubacteriales bacterium SKADARSKE-1]